MTVRATFAGDDLLERPDVAWLIGMAKARPMFPPVLVAAADRLDHGVDADDPPGRVDQRAAGVAVVDRRVGLDRRVVAGRSAAVADLQRPVQRADDAVGDVFGRSSGAPMASTGIADRDRVRVAERDRRQAGLRDLEYRDVRLRASRRRASPVPWWSR